MFSNVGGTALHATSMNRNIGYCYVLIILCLKDYSPHFMFALCITKQTKYFMKILIRTLQYLFTFYLLFCNFQENHYIL